MSDERLDKHQRMRLFCRQTRDRISWRDLRELLRPGRAALSAPSAELQIARRALGDVPLVGFFAGGVNRPQSPVRLHRGADGVHAGVGDGVAQPVTPWRRHHRHQGQVPNIPNHSGAIRLCSLLRGVVTPE